MHASIVLNCLVGVFIFDRIYLNEKLKGKYMAGKNQLKILASLAKKRLIEKNYEVEKKSNTFLSRKVSTYFLENAKAMKKMTAKIEYVSISNKENEEFVKKVVDILNRGNVINPLGMLTDHEYYNNLSERERQFYMLTLSDRYIKVKELYENNKLSEVI